MSRRFRIPHERVADKSVPMQRREQVDTEAKIKTLNVTSFRTLLKRRKHKNAFKIYQVIAMNTMTGVDSFEGVGQVKSPNVKRLHEKYKDVFRTDLAKGLPPKRSVDHAIEKEPEKKPHRPLSQLSPAEHRAEKEYIVDLLNQGKIRSSNSPNGAPLFFVKDGDKPIQGVEDIKTELQVVLHDVQFSYEVASARQAAYSSVRYRAHQYEVGNKVWINKTLFSNAYSRAQSSDKLTAKRYGPFVIQKLVGKNAVRLELPDHLKIHPVVHVIHTTPHRSQPPDIAVPLPEKPAPVPAVLEDKHEVEAILAHRRRGRCYQFLTLLKGTANHDAE
jgi:hypothetical protein